MVLGAEARKRFTSGAQVAPDRARHQRVYVQVPPDSKSIVSRFSRQRHEATEHQVARRSLTVLVFRIAFEVFVGWTSSQHATEKYSEWLHETIPF